MPAEIALLPIVESGYDPLARSASGARGLWQIMTRTGRHYGLRRSAWFDGWLDLETSTNAALNYLAELANKFEGDWLLALSAYNAGEGSIKASIRKNKAAGGDGRYTSLNLNRETLVFVPKLIALRNIIREPERFDISLPGFVPEIRFTKLDVAKPLRLETIARFCN